MCGVTWTLWCVPTRWTREKNCFSGFSELQEAQQRCSDSLDYKFSGHTSQKIYLSRRRTLRKLALVLNGESLPVHSTNISINAQCYSLLSNLCSVLQNLVTPEPLRIGPMWMWCFDSASAPQLSPEVLSLTPWTSCIHFKFPCPEMSPLVSSEEKEY